ncbi:sugar transporter [Sphingobium vermicomposti]|nr:sugar transporter [Sphingobium vermicomposti]
MRPSRSVNILGLILLGWNLMGLVAFILQYDADLSTLAKDDPYTAQIFAQMPGWAWAAYAVAVSAGTLGATLLLMRKAAAVGLFLLSVIAVIVQFGYSFLGTDLLAVKGAATAIFPAIIFAIAVAQTAYARHLRAKGILR